MGTRGRFGDAVTLAQYGVIRRPARRWAFRAELFAEVGMYRSRGPTLIRRRPCVTPCDVTGGGYRLCLAVTHRACFS